MTLPVAGSLVHASCGVARHPAGPQNRSNSAISLQPARIVRPIRGEIEAGPFKAEEPDGGIGMRIHRTANTGDGCSSRRRSGDHLRASRVAAEDDAGAVQEPPSTTDGRTTVGRPDRIGIVAACRSRVRSPASRSARPAGPGRDGADRGREGSPTIADPRLLRESDAVVPAAVRSGGERVDDRDARAAAASRPDGHAGCTGGHAVAPARGGRRGPGDRADRPGRPDAAPAQQGAGPPG